LPSRYPAGGCIEHLERVEILLDVPEKQEVSPGTGDPWHVIGVEVSEKPEYRAALIKSRRSRPVMPSRRS